MDFIDALRQFSKRVDGLKDNLATEEATKNALIMPFFSMLGYDVFLMNLCPNLQQMLELKKVKRLITQSLTTESLSFLLSVSG